MMASHAVVAIRLFATQAKCPNGALGELPSQSLPQISALQTMHSLVTMVVGVILLDHTLTCLNLPLRPSPNTRLELFQLSTESMLCHILTKCSPFVF